ncbi:MAG: hypothetical protein KDD67_14300 [Ignavibacteriae bacterium]|nr:hypothetical protein [Ignavibacteriota bacterium]
MKKHILTILYALALSILIGSANVSFAQTPTAILGCNLEASDPASVLRKRIQYTLELVCALPESDRISVQMPSVVSAADIKTYCESGSEERDGLVETIAQRLATSVSNLTPEPKTTGDSSNLAALANLPADMNVGRVNPGIGAGFEGTILDSTLYFFGNLRIAPGVGDETQEEKFDEIVLPEMNRYNSQILAALLFKPFIIDAEFNVSGTAVGKVDPVTQLPLLEEITVGYWTAKIHGNLVLLKDPAVIITGGYSATNVNRSGFVEAFDNDQNVVKVAEMKVNGQYEFGGRFVFIDTHLDFLNKHARALRRVDDDFIWRVRIGYQSPISKIGSSR